MLPLLFGGGASSEATGLVPAGSLVAPATTAPQSITGNPQQSFQALLGQELNSEQESGLLSLFQLAGTNEPGAELNADVIFSYQVQTLQLPLQVAQAPISRAQGQIGLCTSPDTTPQTPLGARLQELLSPTKPLANTLPILQVLQGELGNIKPGNLPALVLENPFVSHCLAADSPKAAMQELCTLGSMLESLGAILPLQEKVVELGVDLDVPTTPTQFFAALGIAPEIVNTALSELKKSLLNGGLHDYVRAAAIQGAQQRQVPYQSPATALAPKPRAAIGLSPQDGVRAKAQLDEIQAFANNMPQQPRLARPDLLPTIPLAPRIFLEPQAPKLQQDAPQLNGTQIPLLARPDTIPFVTASPLQTKVEILPELSQSFSFPPSANPKYAASPIISPQLSYVQPVPLPVLTEAKPMTSGQIQQMAQVLPNPQPQPQQLVQLAPNGPWLGEAWANKSLLSTAPKSISQRPPLAESMQMGQLLGPTMLTALPTETPQNRQEQEPQDQSGQFTNGSPAPDLRLDDSQGQFRPENEPKRLSQTSRNKIIDTTSFLAREGGGTVKLELGTERLGQVQLAVTIKNDKVEVQVIAGSAAARDSISLELPQLREALRQHNVELRNVEIAVRAPDSMGSSFNSFGQSSQSFAQPERREFLNQPTVSRTRSGIKALPTTNYSGRGARHAGQIQVLA